MLYVIGLGLGSEEDITVRGLSAVKSCSKVVLERYTSILGVEKEKLEAFYDLKVGYIILNLNRYHNPNSFGGNERELVTSLERVGGWVRTLEYYEERIDNNCGTTLLNPLTCIYTWRSGGLHRS